MGPKLAPWTLLSGIALGNTSRHQTIICTNVSQSTMRSRDIRLRPNLLEMLKISVIKIYLNITHLELQSHLPRDNKFNICSWLIIRVPNEINYIKHVCALHYLLWQIWLITIFFLWGMEWTTTHFIFVGLKTTEYWMKSRCFNGGNGYWLMSRYC